jgi:tetratricopeptide (TPR) repeat protein
VAVRARVDEAMFLGRFGDNDAALEIYREILALPVDEHDDQLIAFVLRACVEYSMTVRNLGRPEEALTCLRGTIARFEDVASSLALPWIAWGVRVYARIVSELGRVEEAIAAHDELVALLDPGETVESREWIADALLRKGDFLRDAGDRAGAVDAYRSVFDRFSLDHAGELPRMAAGGGLEAARLSHTFLRFDTSFELAQAIVERFRGSADAELQERVAVAEMIVNALANRKRLLGLLSRAGRAVWPASR